MELKDQVVSLEIAKRLKELGVKQDSLFYWCQASTGEYGLNKSTWEDKAPSGFFAPISAFTVAELGQMLPCRIGENGKELQCIKYPEGWIVGYWDYDSQSWGEHLWSKNAPTEANSRGLMLIYLLENKLITI